MSCKAPAFPFSTWVCAPPYATLVSRPTLSGEEAAVVQEPGSVLVLRVEQPRLPWHELARAVSWLRCHQPGVPLALLLPEVPPLELSITTQLAMGLGVRAVVPANAALDAALRSTLTHPAHLAADLLCWLELRGLPLDGRTAQILAALLRPCTDQQRCADLLAAAGISERSARARLQKKRLPAPAQWLCLFRALRAALLLQRHPEVPLLRLALAHGYADHSALSQQMRRTFSVAVSQVRLTIGWEWLSLRWLRRHWSAAEPAPVTPAAVFRPRRTLCSRCRGRILAFSDMPSASAAGP